VSLPHALLQIQIRAWIVTDHHRVLEYIPSVYRNYFTEPEPHVDNRRLYHMSTKALGGGTAVNAMVSEWCKTTVAFECL
jgi:hypothetical protein